MNKNIVKNEGFKVQLYLIKAIPHIQVTTLTYSILKNANLNEEKDLLDLQFICKSRNNLVDSIYLCFKSEKSKILSKILLNKY